MSLEKDLKEVFAKHHVFFDVVQKGEDFIVSFNSFINNECVKLVHVGSEELMPKAAERLEVGF